VRFDVALEQQKVVALEQSHNLPRSRRAIPKQNKAAPPTLPGEPLRSNEFTNGFENPTPMNTPNEQRGPLFVHFALRTAQTHSVPTPDLWLRLADKEVVESRWRS